MAPDLATCAPHPQEILSDYVRRLRQQRSWTQVQLSEAAGVHRQTVGKIENGLSQRLNRRVRKGLALALSIPLEYLEAVCEGADVPSLIRLKFCPQCWVPGTAPESMWTDPRSHYCFGCGTELTSRCRQCKEPIGSLQFRFCPYCGTAYKPTSGTAA
jgi:DNA-binding XRE family transcriptional regulator